MGERAGGPLAMAPFGIALASGRSATHLLAQGRSASGRDGFLRSGPAANGPSAEPQARFCGAYWRWRRRWSPA